jgi:DNA-binding winged helix-turn-helix (wHTH) protein
MTNGVLQLHQREPVVSPPPGPSVGSLGQLMLVAPDAIPAGAVVVGVLVTTQNEAVDSPVPAGAFGTPFQVCAPGLRLDRAGRRVIREEREPLTRREYDLFEHLASRPGRVHTRGQLLRAVWDFSDPSYCPDRTVDVHVARLRRKLGPPHAAAVETVRGVGYRWTARTGESAPAEVAAPDLSLPATPSVGRA